MAEFAPVVNVELAQQLKADGHLGSYHLLLAHDVVKRPLEYESVFLNLPNKYIIMDNSSCELGKPVDIQTMKEARRIVGATVCVLPDIIGDARATMEATLGSYNAWYLAGLGPFMVVPQGRNLQEFMLCVQSFKKLLHVQAWGVPRATVKSMGTRMSALRVVVEHARAAQDIHLLGFSDNIFDDITCAKQISVRGIDSNVPIRYGRMGLKLDELLLGNPQVPRGESWEESNYNHLIGHNLQMVRKLIRS